MHHYAEEFAFGGLPVAQVLLERSGDRTLPERPNTLRALLEAGVPDRGENDTVATAELKFGDNDRLAALVAHTVEADALVILSDIDAVYDADPRANANATPLEALWADDPTPLRSQGPSDPGTAPEGWRPSSRPRASRPSEASPRASRPAARASSASSRLRGGGHLLAERRRGARKAWIAHGAELAGRVVVDAGARGPRGAGTSLLARGVVSVEGAFDAGASVAIVCDGDVFAHGLAGTARRTSARSPARGAADRAPRLRERRRRRPSRRPRAALTRQRRARPHERVGADRGVRDVLVPDSMHQLDRGTGVCDAVLAAREDVLVHPRVEVVEAAGELELLAVDRDRAIAERPEARVAAGRSSASTERNQRTSRSPAPTRRRPCRPGACARRAHPHRRRAT